MALSKAQQPLVGLVGWRGMVGSVLMDRMQAEGDFGLIEPVFFWPDALEELHRRSVEPGHLSRLKRFPADSEARAAVARLRTEMIDLFASLGATHLQVARTYPLRQSHDPAAWELLKRIKHAVDPQNLMNPGSLGL